MNTLIDPVAKIYSRSKTDYMTYGAMALTSCAVGTQTSVWVGLIGGVATGITEWVMRPKNVEPVAPYKKPPTTSQSYHHDMLAIGCDSGKTPRKLPSFKSCHRTLLNIACGTAITAVGLGALWGGQTMTLKSSPEAKYAQTLVKSGVELRNGESVQDSLNPGQTALENVRIEMRSERPWYTRFFASYGRVSYDVPLDYTNLITGEKHATYRDTMGFGYRDVKINDQDGRKRITAMTFIPVEQSQPHTTHFDWSARPKPDTARTCVGPHDPTCR